jgi:hypothetical protein
MPCGSGNAPFCLQQRRPPIGPCQAYSSQHHLPYPRRSPPCQRSWKRDVMAVMRIALAFFFLLWLPSIESCISGTFKLPWKSPFHHISMARPLVKNLPCRYQQHPLFSSRHPALPCSQLSPYRHLHIHLCL